MNRQRNKATHTPDVVRPWFEYSAHPPLSRTHRTLSKEWHPLKNGNLTPGDFTYGSNERVWWQCKVCKHAWEARIEDRAIKMSGCPSCTGKVATSRTSLKARYPKIAAEWHPSLNNGKRPSEVTPKSSFVAVWFCSANPAHETWSCAVSNRTNGSNCPSCAGSRPSRDYSLAACFPELANQWYHEMNGELKPTDVTPGSKKVVWWKCPEGPDHIWQSPVANRTKTGKGCGYCHGLRVSVTNSLKSLFPAVASEWHEELNGKLTAGDVVARSQLKVWWQCGVNPAHHWEARVQDRVQKNSGCRECAGLAPLRSRRQRAPGL